VKNCRAEDLEDCETARFNCPAPTPYMARRREVTADCTFSWVPELSNVIELLTRKSGVLVVVLVWVDVLITAEVVLSVEVAV
jgi:hypothetical protein